MTDQLKRALAHVHAEDSLKEQTRSFLAGRTRGYRSSPVVSPMRLAAAAACLVLLLTGAGAWACFTPTSTVSIDVNPSLELRVNRFDRVISVSGFNEEGQTLADAFNLTFLPCSVAVEQLLDSQDMASYLSQDPAITITVVGSDQGQQQRLLTALEACTSGHQGTYCCALNPEEVESAHHLGLSYGKYAAYLSLAQLDASITPEQVQQMSMRQIHDLLAALSGQWEDSPVEDNCQGGIPESGHGHGYAHGKS